LDKDASEDDFKTLLAGSKDQLDFVPPLAFDLLYARLDGGVLLFFRLCLSAGLLAGLHHLGVVCNAPTNPPKGTA
jgi:hypothetical protein